MTAGWADAAGRLLARSLCGADDRTAARRWPSPLERQDMRKGPNGIAVLHDWDAVFLDRETLLAGFVCDIHIVASPVPAARCNLMRAARALGFIRAQQEAVPHHGG